MSSHDKYYYDGKPNVGVNMTIFYFVNIIACESNTKEDAVTEPSDEVVEPSQEIMEPNSEPSYELSLEPFRRVAIRRNVQ